MQRVYYKIGLKRHKLCHSKCSNQRSRGYAPELYPEGCLSRQQIEEVLEPQLMAHLHQPFSNKIFVHSKLRTVDENAKKM